MITATEARKLKEESKQIGIETLIRYKAELGVSSTVHFMTKEDAKVLIELGYTVTKLFNAPAVNTNKSCYEVEW